MQAWVSRLVQSSLHPVRELTGTEVLCPVCREVFYPYSVFGPGPGKCGWLIAVGHTHPGKCKRYAEFSNRLLLNSIEGRRINAIAQLEKALYELEEATQSATKEMKAC